MRSQTSVWLEGVGALLRPVIARDEAERIAAVTQSPVRVTFLVGTAGGGKTVVLHQAVDKLMAAGVATLAISLDRYGPLGSTRELGRHFGFDASPVTALAAADRPAVRVIDQLDAVSGIR